MNELKEQRKQTAAAMDQNTKLMATLKSNLCGNGLNNESRAYCGGTFTHAEAHMQKLWRDDVFHEDDDCFKVEKTKEKHPVWYKDK